MDLRLIVLFSLVSGCFDPEAVPYDAHLDALQTIDTGDLPPGFGSCGRFEEVAQQTTFVNRTGLDITFLLVAEDCVVHHEATLPIDGEDVALAAPGLVLRVRSATEPPEWLLETTLDAIEPVDGQLTVEIEL